MNSMASLAMDQSAEQFIILSITLLFPPVFCLCVLVIVLASFGKSLGIRKAYVHCLLELFEWARHSIDKTARQEQTAEVDSPPSDDDHTRREGPHSYTPQEKERARHPSGGGGIIRHEALERFRQFRSAHTPADGSQVEIAIADSFDFVTAGIECIIEDECTSRFNAEELITWNLLTRTSHFYFKFASWKITFIYFLGMVFRYCLLLPGRLILLTVGLTTFISLTTLISYIPHQKLKKWFYWHTSLMCFRILSRSVSAIITYHNVENKAKPGGICVANHTSPIDVIMLSCDNCYALVGQRQGGLLGIIQRSLHRAASHVWFERSEANDRSAVAQRLRDHVTDTSKQPILIFPEGVCINNTSVMQFKKGSFEVGGVIYPAAIKYDPRFGDSFWNSSQQSFVQYLLMMASSWAIVCDIWYLPPMHRMEGESSIDFANRVKRLIAQQGGLVDLEWDGMLKRQLVKPSMLEQTRAQYSRRLQSARPPEPYASEVDFEDAKDK